MKRASVTLIFDFPLQINEYSIFDVGSDKEYIDWESSLAEFDQAYHAQIKSELQAVCQLCSERKIALSAYFSGIFVKLLQQTDETILAKIKEATKNGLELLGGTYNHSLTSVYSLPHFIEEIEEHTALLTNVFDVKPNHFYNCENIYFNELAQQLKSLGFKSTFAGAIAWYLGDNPHARLFHAGDAKSFYVCLTDADAGSSFFDNEEQLNHFMQFDLDMIKQFAGVKSIVKVIQRKAEILALADHCGSEKSTKPYKIKSPVMGSIHGRSLDNYIGQGMQSSVFNLYYEADWKKIPKHKLLHQQYRLLGQSLGFLALAPKSTSSNQSPYERYSQLINILSDLKIKIG